jgi:hypothetical protein
MPDDRPKHGKNGVRIDPKSSMGHQHKNRYGEVLPETKPFKQTYPIQQADPDTKEWQQLQGIGPKKELMKRA